MGTLLAMIISLSVMSGCGQTAAQTVPVTGPMRTHTDAAAVLPPPVTAQAEDEGDELDPVQPVSAPPRPSSAPTTKKEQTQESNGTGQAPKRKAIWIPEPLVLQPYLGGYLNAGTVRR